MRGNSVVVIGSICIDQVKQRYKSVHKLGGVVTYAGITYRRHDLDTYIITKISKKDSTILKVLDEQGITIINGESKETTFFVDHIEGDTRWEEILERAEPISRDQLATVVNIANHIHLGPLHPDDIDPGVIELIAENNIPMSLDLQGYTRLSTGSMVAAGVSERIEKALLNSIIVKGNSKELDIVLSHYQLNISQFLKQWNIMEVIITDGSRGGCIITKNGTEVKYHAKETDSVIDATGAGDVFLASYLSFRFFQKRDIKEACEHASIIAAKQVAGQYIEPDLLKLKFCKGSTSYYY